VAGKDLASNTLTVVQGHEHPLLYQQSLQAQDVSWVSGKVPALQEIYGAKTRYRQADASCQIFCRQDQTGLEKFELDFTDKQWAITPGQSAVIYQNEVCLGGGIIY
jgi:tRNA-specific 2-thiouridylase